MSGFLDRLRRRMAPGPRLPATGSGLSYRTTDQLDAALLTIQTTTGLQRLYQGTLEFPAETEHLFEEVVSCSHTSNFVAAYLSYGRIRNGEVDGRQIYFSLDGGERDFDAGQIYVRYNVALNRVLNQPIPCVVIGECTDISHVVTLANTGSGWCLYQSNVGTRKWLTDPNCYVISDRLNRGRGRGQKQRHNLDAVGLAMLFGELVGRNNHQTLFFGTKPLRKWMLRAFSMDGRTMDLSK